jgi:hypothetical protein
MFCQLNAHFIHAVAMKHLPSMKNEQSAESMLITLTMCDDLDYHYYCVMATMA